MLHAETPRAPACSGSGLGSVLDFQWAGDLHVELINATATWDTTTFLTQAPEPAAGATGAVALAAIAGCARARRLGGRTRIG
jgi:hypothetical protein